MKSGSGSSEEKAKIRQIAIRIAILAIVLLCAWCVSKWGGGLFTQKEDTAQDTALTEPSSDTEDLDTPAPTAPPSDAETRDTSAPTELPSNAATQDTPAPAGTIMYHFRSDRELNQHFEKHGAEFDYQTAQEYEAGANRVIADERSLHKQEKEDGDDVYYLEETNEFVVVSQKGVIRTYFKPDAGKAYYERQ